MDAAEPGDGQGREIMRASRTEPSGSEDHPAGRRSRWRDVLLAVAAAATAVFAFDLIFHPSLLDSEVIPGMGMGLPFLAGALLCAARAHRTPSERTAWGLMSLALLLWGLGDVTYRVTLADEASVPVPSFADVLWLAFYLPAYASLYLLLRSRVGRMTRVHWLDAIVAGLGIGGAAAAVAFQEILARTDEDWLATATILAYPIGDLGLLALIGAAIAILGWGAAGAWRWIAAALVVFAVADSIYLVQVAQGTYELGGLLDLGWPVTALLIGVAAWLPGDRAREAGQLQPTIVVPLLSGLAALTLFLIDHVVRLNAVALGLASLSVVVMLARLFLTAQENARLMARTHQKATTDALTGLGNRRQLAADMARHLEALNPDRPLTLTLFDLDGFKDYNDTFGHLSGDQLLERLGVRLTDMLAGRGTAYRMGGDEFCTLWAAGETEAGAPTIEAAEAALSERGRGFSIGCSSGSVQLPIDTTDAMEALRTADRRMYASKGRGRVSAGRQSSDILLRALESRDTELAAHMGGVATLACATAKRLGVGREDMEATRQTALLHDVGKVALPDALLSKPGPLDAEEWAFVKRHTLIGERIISAAPALEAVAALVRSTHERWDGAGYPDGLTGRDIPLVARIVNVCATHHAMMDERAYRVARDAKDATAELRRCSGTQFDPAVVDAFVEVLESSPSDGEAGTDYTRDTGRRVLSLSSSRSATATERV